MQKVLIQLTEGDVQEIAQQDIGRNLTKKEIEYVVQKLNWELTDEVISEAIESVPK